MLLFIIIPKINFEKLIPFLVQKILPNILKSFLSNPILSTIANHQLQILSKTFVCVESFDILYTTSFIKDTQTFHVRLVGIWLVYIFSLDWLAFSRHRIIFSAEY